MFSFKLIAIRDATLMATFAAGTLLTRGAGCTINDIWDHKLDAQVNDYDRNVFRQFII